MPNRREFDHIGAFNFRVEIEGVTQGEFFFVSGLQGATAAIEFRNGNGGLLRKRPGRTRYGNLTLRRGFTNSNELFDWYKAVMDGTVERKSGSIIIVGDDSGDEIVRYNFFEAWPCRWMLSDFDSNDDEVLFEEIELAIEKIERG